MHQLQRHGSSVGQLGRIVTTSRGHCHAQLRTNAGTTRKDRMPHGSHQPGRRPHASGLLKMGAQSLFGAYQQTHGTSDREDLSTQADRHECQYNLIINTVNLY
jgi:hypothetical protein